MSPSSVEVLIVPEFDEEPPYISYFNKKRNLQTYAKYSGLPLTRVKHSHPDQDLYIIIHDQDLAKQNERPLNSYIQSKTSLTVYGPAIVARKDSKKNKFVSLTQHDVDHWYEALTHLDK